MIKNAAIAVVLFAWLGGLCYGHYRISNSIRHANEAREGIVLPPLSQLSPRILNVLTLGHRGVYDDFVHVWLNHFLVDGELLKEHPDQVLQIGDILLSLRPMIETSYVLTCVAFFEDLDKPEYCEPVIQTGMKIFPKSFMLPMMQGYIFYNRLDDPTRAAAYYAMAAQSEKAPPHIIRVAKKLLQKKSLDESEIDQMTFDFQNMFEKQALLELIKKQEARDHD